MSAIISADGYYRFRLDRELGALGARGGAILWIMLNPSRADAERNDPTLRRCINFSTLWGFARLMVGNLYAMRATKPQALKRPPHGIDPVGPENDTYLLQMASEADLIMLAWGQRGPQKHRWDEVTDMLWVYGRKTAVLGWTKAGEPRHPLMMPKDAQRIPYFAGHVEPSMMRPNVTTDPASCAGIVGSTLYH